MHPRDPSRQQKGTYQLDSKNRDQANKQLCESHWLIAQISLEWVDARSDEEETRGDWYVGQLKPGMSSCHGCAW